MKQEISVLLVHNQDDPLNSLRAALESQSIQLRRAQTCEELHCLLKGLSVPHLIFTDTTLPDGTWADVLSLAADTIEPANVIVVSRIVDIKLYIEAIECGAFDFVVPPFAGPDLDHVLRCAIGNVTSRRNSLVKAAQPSALSTLSTIKAPGSKSVMAAAAGMGDGDHKPL